VSNKHLTWAFDQATKTSTDKLVLIFLADKANEDTGECWPLQETIAERCCVRRETVYRSIAKLQAAGFVQVERQAGPNGEGMPSIYRLPLLKTQERKSLMGGDQESLVKATHKNTPNVPFEKTRKAKPEMTYSEWAASLATGQRPLPAADPVFAYATRIGLPFEFLRLAWLEFRRKHTEGSGSAKKQKDWRMTFRNYVEGNYLKLWFLDAGEYRLTTVGAQAQKLHGGEHGR